jgi:hypothetical protein
MDNYMLVNGDGVASMVVVYKYGLMDLFTKVNGYREKLLVPADWYILVVIIMRVNFLKINVMVMESL